MIREYRERPEGTEPKLWADHWSSQDLSESYLDGVEWDAYPKVLARHIPRGAAVLEAGCGIGKYAIHVARQGHRVIGIDLDRQALLKAHRYDPSPTFLVADVARLPFPAGSFDAYVSLGVVEHFEQGCRHVLDEAGRVLKPSGVAIVSVPYLHLLKRLTRAFQAGNPRRTGAAAGRQVRSGARVFYQYVFTRGEIVRVLQKAGFSIAEIAFSNKLRWFSGRFRRLRNRLPLGSESGHRLASPGVTGKRRSWLGLLKRLALWGERALPGWLSAHMIVLAGELA